MRFRTFPIPGALLALALGTAPGLAATVFGGGAPPPAPLGARGVGSAVLADAEKSDPRADARLTNELRATEVKTKLIEKLGTDAVDIAVTVSGSEAFLVGHVEKKATQEMAKEVALSVPGIKAVDNELREVEGDKPATAARKEVQDALLESKVKNVLLAEIGVNAFRIEVEATDGVVSLRGKVLSSSLAKAALTRTQAVKGVKRVVNLLNA